MLEIRPGRNIWIWARTDSDAPTSDDAIRSCVSVMSRTLPDVVPGIVPPASPKGPPDASRYFLGAARPMDVRASQTRPPFPRGLQSWDRNQLPELYAVSAQNPWWVSCDFDWRGPTFTVDPWPRRKVNALGLAVDDPQRLDWLLMYAAHMGDATRPDGDWTDDAVDTASKGVGMGLVFAAAALLVYLSSHGRR